MPTCLQVDLRDKAQLSSDVGGQRTRQAHDVLGGLSGTEGRSSLHNANLCKTMRAAPASACRTKPPARPCTLPARKFLLACLLCHTIKCCSDALMSSMRSAVAVASTISFVSSARSWASTACNCNKTPCFRNLEACLEAIRNDVRQLHALAQIRTGLGQALLETCNVARSTSYPSSLLSETKHLSDFSNVIPQ